MFSFLALWLATQFISAALVWLFTVGLGKPVGPGPTPPVAVIVAVRGHGPEFDQFLLRLFEQDYPDFRVIFAVESESDDAVEVIKMCQGISPSRVTLVVAGLSENEGQKTRNLRHATNELTDEDEIVVLADADIWPERDWLRRLVAPLVENKAQVTTGFTWLIVQDGKFSSKVAAAMAASVATIPRFSFLTIAWGGSTALKREDFDALEMEENWRGTLSDDLQLTTIAQDAGYRIFAPPELLPKTGVQTKGFAEVLAQAKRWYMLVRVHMPLAYFLTLLGMTFAAAGWIVAIIGTLVFRLDALIVLAVAAVLSVVRMMGRARIVMRLFGKPGLDASMSYLLSDPIVSPFATMISAYCGWAALLMRRTTWAGITYQIDGPQQVKILARDGIAVAAKD